MGSSGGKLTREEGGDDPSERISRRRGGNSGTLGCCEDPRLIGGGGWVYGVGGLEKLSDVGEDRAGGSWGRRVGRARPAAREGEGKPCLLQSIGKNEN